MMWTLRPTTEVRIERAGAGCARIILGLVLMMVGFGFDYLEYRPPPPHTTHLILFTSVAVLGVLLVAGRFVFPLVQQVIVILGQTSLPFVGGRRAGDPPAPPSGGAS